MKKTKHIMAFSCLLCIFVGAFILSFTSPSMAATFCVGTSAELQSALTVSGTNSQDDSIQVQQGTYYGNFVYASTEAFGVTFEGGFTIGCGSRVVDPANTVLDGGENGVVLALIAQDVTADFAVDGITLQNGNVIAHGGGGIYIITERGSVSVNNNIIRDNYSSESTGGGGVLIYRSEVATVSNNTITNNTGYRGGGVAIKESITVNVTGNIFDGNSCQDDGAGLLVRGGEISLSENIFRNNTGRIAAGLLIDGDPLYILNNTIINNQATYRTGGAHIGNGEEIYIINNLISYNSSLGGGGCGGLGASAYYDPHKVALINNTISYNTTNGDGGGLQLILHDNLATANIYNNIIFNNSAAGLGNDIHLLNDLNTDYNSSIVNLFNNDFDQSSAGTYMQLTFSIDPRNLNNVDPLFIDPTNDDYHLGVGSPCINSGENTAPSIPEIDKDGNPRIMDGIVDMGAYEYPGAAIPIIDSFIASPTSGEVPLTVTFTCVAHDFGGSIATYTLDYGDGGSPETNSTGTFQLRLCNRRNIRCDMHGG